MSKFVEQVLANKGACIGMVKYKLGGIKFLVTMRDITFKANEQVLIRPICLYKNVPPSAYIF